MSLLADHCRKLAQKLALNNAQGMKHTAKIAGFKDFLNTGILKSLPPWVRLDCTSGSGTCWWVKCTEIGVENHLDIPEGWSTVLDVGCLFQSILIECRVFVPFPDTGGWNCENK